MRGGRERRRTVAFIQKLRLLLGATPMYEQANWGVGSKLGTWTFQKSFKIERTSVTRSKWNRTTETRHIDERLHSILQDGLPG